MLREMTPVGDIVILIAMTLSLRSTTKRGV